MAFFDRSRRRKRPRVDIVPLIDVMFILVAFFMLFSSFTEPHEGAPVTTPDMVTAEELNESTSIIITVTSDGRYFFGENPIALQDIPEAVQAALAAQPNSFVYVRGDAHASLGTVWSAVDAARYGGAVDFWIEAEGIEGPL